MSERVLVIDNDPGLLTLLSMGLAREGFDVVTARSGIEGLHKAYALHPDVVVLDIMMPEMDGWTTCERLRQVSDVPIILLTGVSDTQSVVRGLGLGADDYVTAPAASIPGCTNRAAMRHKGEGPQAVPPIPVLDDGCPRWVDLAAPGLGRPRGQSGRSSTPIDAAADAPRQPEDRIAPWPEAKLDARGDLSMLMRPRPGRLRAACAQKIPEDDPRAQPT